MRRKAPDVFSSVFRSDENARDTAETYDLYKSVKHAHESSVFDSDDMGLIVVQRIASYLKAHARLFDYDPINDAFDECVQEIVDREDVLFSLPVWPGQPSMSDKVWMREFLRAKQKLLADEEHYLNLFAATIGRPLQALAEAIPPFSNERSLTVVPLLSVIPKPSHVVGEIIASFCSSEVAEANLFESIRAQLIQNLHRASGVLPGKEPTRPLIEPRDSKLPAEEMIETYLRDTPFLQLFQVAIPFAIPEHLRVHTAVIAKTGWGKTQLLQSLILDELKKDSPPSMIILDSTGQMVDRIQSLAVFNERLQSRLLVIDPEHSPALNMFDSSNPRYDGYTPEQRANIQTEIIALFNYVFASKDYDLSAHMGTAFSYAVRVIISRKGSTITDLRHLLEEQPRGGVDGSRFKNDILALDPDTVDFFRHHFFEKAYIATRMQIARRIHSLIAIPAFNRMFTAVSNALDLFSDMQQGTIVLVNTNQNLLKEDGSILFGRYIVAQAISAIFERANISRDKRRVAHLIIDEAAPYFDSTFDTLLTRVRQFGLKATIAFQHIDQLPNDKLRNAIAGQTSVKYIGGLSHADARRLAPEVRTTSEFLSDLRRDTSVSPRWAEFAVYADDYTPTAVKLKLPFLTLESEPQMTREQHAAQLLRNKARVAAVPRPLPEEPRDPAPVVVETPRTTSPSDGPNPQPQRTRSQPRRKRDDGERLW